MNLDITSTQINRFIEALFRGRLFEFDAEASRNSAIKNNPNEAQVLLAYMSAAGYSCGVHDRDLSTSYIDDQVQDFFLDMTDGILTVASIKDAFMKGYENGRRARGAEKGY